MHIKDGNSSNNLTIFTTPKKITDIHVSEEFATKKFLGISEGAQELGKFSCEVQILHSN